VTIASPTRRQSEAVERELGPGAHGSGRGRAEVDADDYGVRETWACTGEPVFAACDVGAIATGIASRSIQTQDDPFLRGLRRLVDDRKDDDASPREPRQRRVRRIRRAPISKADAVCHPRGRLLGRRDALHRPVRGVERPICAPLPARQGTELQRLCPWRNRYRGDQFDHGPITLTAQRPSVAGVTEPRLPLPRPSSRAARVP
jgi:hypothetical protein